MMYGTLCTEFYDADKPFATTEEIDFYKSIFSKHDLILEPMCGSGRLLIPLMQEGFTIHGIDNSSQMLKSCNRRAAKFDLKPILFEGHIENTILDLKYDGIIIPLGSFQLFHPRKLAYQMLEKFKTLLKPNGKLILDLFIPWDTLWENNEEETSQREITLDDGSIIKIVTHSIADKFEQYCTSKSVYTKKMNDKILATENEQMYISWYYHYEMKLLLEKFGYKNIHYLKRTLNQSEYITYIAEI